MMRDEVDFSIVPHYDLWRVHNLAEVNVQAVENADSICKSFINIFVSSTNHRFHVTYPVLEALVMLDPQQWSYFSNLSRKNLVEDNVDLLLKTFPFALKCGVKGALGLPNLSVEETTEILNNFKDSIRGEDKVSAGMKAVLKARIISSAHAVLSHRRILKFGDPQIDIGKEKDMCRH